MGFDAPLLVGPEVVVALVGDLVDALLGAFVTGALVGALVVVVGPAVMVDTQPSHMARASAVGLVVGEGAEVGLVVGARVDATPTMVAMPLYPVLKRISLPKAHTLLPE